MGVATFDHGLFEYSNKLQIKIKIQKSIKNQYVEGDFGEWLLCTNRLYISILMLCKE